MNYSRLKYEYVTRFELESISEDKFYEIEKSEGECLVYIGRATCPYCVDFIVNLEKISNKSEIKRVLYLDSMKIQDDEFFKKYGIEYAPKLFFVLNGELVDIDIYNLDDEQVVRYLLNLQD